MRATEKMRSLDPRTALLLLLLANISAFTPKALWLEAVWIVFLAIIIAICGRGKAAIQWGFAFVLLYCFQAYVLPASPKIIATSLSIFANYARRMFPCLMVGMLMIKAIPLRHFILGLRKLHFPQKLIVAISVTLRYFPAIREEVFYIRDAMKLRDIHGLRKVEYTAIPLMLSASGTAEELSAAAVTRGIENPAPKTSILELRPWILDWVCLFAATVFTILTFMIK